MILAALLALTGAQVAAQPEETPDDVVVMAERIKRFRAVTRKDRKTGVTRCVVKRPSGDPALDAGICSAMLACVPKVSNQAEIRACMEPAMKALIPSLPWRATRG